MYVPYVSFLPPETSSKKLYPNSLPGTPGFIEQWIEIDHVNLLPSATIQGFLVDSILIGYVSARMVVRHRTQRVR